MRSLLVNCWPWVAWTLSQISGTGYRRLIVAVVAGLTLASAQAQTAPTKGQPEQGASKQGPTDNAATAGNEYLPWPDKNADACYGAHNHDTADLCAQWRAAVAAENGVKWASWGDYIGAVGAFLSFVSVVLVVIALWQTRKANRILQAEFDKAREEAAIQGRDAASALAQARRNADAVIKQVIASERNAERQLRAYVFLSRIVCKEEVDDQGITRLHTFSAEWKNFGQTPAQNVKVFANAWHWHGAKLPPWFPYPDLIAISGPEDGKPNIIAPGETIEVRPEWGGMDPTMREEVAQGRRRIFCWGWITYDDRFGKSHRVTYCRRIRIVGFEGVGRFEPTYYDQHNCVDEECDRELAERPPFPTKLARGLEEERRVLGRLKAVNGEHGLVAENTFWESWLREQWPATFDRHPDGTAMDPTPRDYYGVTLDTYENG